MLKAQNIKVRTPPGFRWLRPALLVGAVATTLGVASCGGDSNTSGAIRQPSAPELAAGGLDKLPIAPQSERIDLAGPTFSNPTDVSNPLFPIAKLHSAVLSGKVGGKPFHTETTLLPYTRTIEYAPGKRVETVVSQYVAYLDGRVEEVALDYYAQADDGAVWYLGEEVYDYNRDGLIDGTQGTWLAGRDGPIAMIMPGDPQVGNVHRAENLPGVAFEEVTVGTVGKTVDGPLGPVDGALVGDELHDDGTHSDKVFAPGYGEFYSAHEGDVEALALAIPTNALDASVPPELKAISAGAQKSLDAIDAANWTAAASSVDALTSAWSAYRKGEVPVLIAAEMETTLKTLAAGIAARDYGRAGNAAIDVAQSSLDLQLRHRPVAEIDLARFKVWAQQILVHSQAGDNGGVNGDIATMVWIRGRFAAAIDPVDRTKIDVHLDGLRSSVVDVDPAASKAEAISLLKTLDRMGV